MANPHDRPGAFADGQGEARQASDGIDPGRGEAISAERHVDMLREAGMIPPVDSRPGFELIRQAFITGDAGRFSVKELSEAGLVDASKLKDQGEERRLEDVKEIVFRKSSETREGDKPAHFRIKADGTIEVLRHPDKSAKPGDDEIIVEMDDSSAQIRAMSERQKAAARQMIAYLESRYRAARMSPVIPADLLRALYEEPAIPPVSARPRSGGYNGHRISPPRAEMPAMPSGGFTPESVGRSPATDMAERDAFKEIGPVGDIKDVAGLQGFLDRVVHAVSANEGGFTSVNWNDNGHGISIGKAQWNQKAGELPSLLKRWHDADPQLFNRVFGDDAGRMLNESFVRGANITKGSELGNKIQEALKQPEFQQVQTEMLREKALKALQLSTKYGHTSELFVAEVADMANQFGWGGAEACLRKANVANIQDERTAIRALMDVGQDKWSGRQHRDAKLAKLFSPDVQALA